MKYPFDLLFRAVADAVALKNAEHAEVVAAQLGEERRGIAAEWISYYDSKLTAFVHWATILGLRKRHDGTADEDLKIEPDVRG